MSDSITEITHRNVLRLVDAHTCERERIDDAMSRIMALETQVRSLLIQVEKLKKQSDTAFALAQQTRV